MNTTHSAPIGSTWEDHLGLRCEILSGPTLKGWRCQTHGTDRRIVYRQTHQLIREIEGMNFNMHYDDNDAATMRCGLCPDNPEIGTWTYRPTTPELHAVAYQHATTTHPGAWAPRAGAVNITDPTATAEASGFRVEGVDGDWVAHIDGAPVGRYRYRADALAHVHGRARNTPNLAHLKQSDIPIRHNPDAGTESGITHRRA